MSAVREASSLSRRADERRARLRSALAQRLRTVADALLDRPPNRSADPSRDAALTLDALVRRLHGSRDPAGTWLLLTAVGGAFPTSDELDAMLRTFELADPDRAALAVLDECYAAATAAGAPEAELDLVVGGTVVDVHTSATDDLHTGIQRVVRETLPRWAREHRVTPVAWTAAGGVTRPLSATERARVLSWGRTGAPPADEEPSARIIVPWRSVVVLPERAGPATATRLACLAEWSGNRLVVVGYDFIPVTGADTVPAREPASFVRFLTVVKRAHRVVGISASASAEFAGFVAMLHSQGLAGPQVLTCRLPSEAPPPPSREALPSGGPPLVLCVGSHEPRKNHLAVLHAAEQLWRSGRVFRLRFVGGSGWLSDDFERRVHVLQRAGRDVELRRRVTDEELWAGYREARFTVFPSLQEGYGLPAAESLACGTPVVTTRYGSCAEVAADGGALLVDPRDDAAVRDAMAELLDDDATLHRLADEAARRPTRTWDDYARELWDLAHG